jgi:hypothetical protein
MMRPYTAFKIGLAALVVLVVLYLASQGRI